MARRTFWVILILTWLAANLLWGQQWQFQVLGNLGGDEGTGTSSQALAVSGDGQCVVGDSLASAALGITTDTEAFYVLPLAKRWQLQSIGTLAGGGPYSSARGVSLQGQVIVGECQVEGLKQAFRWTKPEGMIALGVLPGHDESVAWSVSGDGNIIVGQSSSLQGELAFRWTAADGMTSLGDLPGGNAESTALAISRDGTTIVGHSSSERGTEAFLWRDGELQGLGSLQGPRFASRAYAVSADGKFVVGESISQGDPDKSPDAPATPSLGDSWEAFLWSRETGMRPLGDLPGGRFQSKAIGVSSDGTTVVGNATSDNGSEPFLWTANGGMQSLQALLDKDGVTNGFQLKDAWGTSDNGRIIVGVGLKPIREGKQETAGWVAIR